MESTLAPHDRFTSPALVPPHFSVQLGFSGPPPAGPLVYHSFLPPPPHSSTPPGRIYTHGLSLQYPSGCSHRQVGGTGPSSAIGAGYRSRTGYSPGRDSLSRLSHPPWLPRYRLSRGRSVRRRHSGRHPTPPPVIPRRGGTAPPPFPLFRTERQPPPSPQPQPEQLGPRRVVDLFAFQVVGLFVVEQPSSSICPQTQEDGLPPPQSAQRRLPAAGDGADPYQAAGAAPRAQAAHP